MNEYIIYFYYFIFYEHFTVQPDTDNIKDSRLPNLVN